LMSGKERDAVGAHAPAVDLGYELREFARTRCERWRVQREDLARSRRRVDARRLDHRASEQRALGRTIRVPHERLAAAVDAHPPRRTIAPDPDEWRDVPRVARTLPMRVGSPPRERRREDAGIALRHFQPEAVAVPAIRELVDEHGLRHARPDAAEVLVIATAGDRDRM